MDEVDKQHAFSVGPTKFTQYHMSVPSNTVRNPIS
jgi:hypothetical protein